MPTTRTASIRLQTALPGPRSLELSARRNAAVPRGVGHATPIYAASARGALLTDVDGNVLIDFAGGIGTLNVGHANPEVVRAAAAQLERFTHTCFSVAPYEGYVALAEKLNAIAPGPGPKKTMLANSGAEAVENAVKIARRATGREAVVVFEHAFHGRTLLTMSMTSKVRPYKDGFGPFAPEIYRLPYPYEYRDRARASAAFLEEFFLTHVAADKVACVVLELVLGEGGFVVAPREYVEALARICRERGILLVADEVQTGFGRTGRLFACEHYGLEPDLVTMAKSLAGGLPLSAVTGRADVMDAAQIGGLGGTYTGNPVACAAALAAIAYLEEHRLVERAAAIGRAVETRFRGFAERFPFIGEARGLGAMRALEIVKDRTGREPDKDRTDRILRRACEKGLLLVGAGTFGNVIRTLMPLVITDDELAEGLDVLDHALQEA
jgi:4-aminobutyrate aminotransferase / (S)-3-amino-2-methylpropionate transaminase / 5-aminovalerate transaminase